MCALYQHCPESYPSVILGDQQLVHPIVLARKSPYVEASIDGSSTSQYPMHSSGHNVWVDQLPNNEQCNAASNAYALIVKNVSGEWSALKPRYVHSRELMNHIDMYFEGGGGPTALTPHCLVLPDSGQFELSTGHLCRHNRGEGRRLKALGLPSHTCVLYA